MRRITLRRGSHSSVNAESPRKSITARWIISITVRNSYHVINDDGDSYHHLQLVKRSNIIFMPSYLSKGYLFEYLSCSLYFCNSLFTDFKRSFTRTFFFLLSINIELFHFICAYPQRMKNSRWHCKKLITICQRTKTIRKFIEKFNCTYIIKL